MPKFMINQKAVNDQAGAYIVAECCDNHLGNIDIALEMIRLSKLAGASAVKFQHHLPDEEMLPDTPMSANMLEPLYDFLKKYALTIDQHKTLKAYCDQIGIQYLCTPFSLKAAEELKEANVLDAVKIGSGELTDLPTLKAIASFNIPMILSTGMATFEEIDKTYQLLCDSNISFALMNCISEYPPRYEDINLGVIAKMRARYPQALIGHSDHTPTLFTSFAAVAMGAKIIEKHVIVDKLQPGPDQSVSIDFNELAELVRGIRIIEAASGAEKKIHAKEASIREWAHRSIVTTQALSKGEFITPESIWSKRPGTGIPASHRDQLIGRRLAKNVEANTLLCWDDLA